MANTIFKDLTTRSAFTSSPNDKVASIYLGDSKVSGSDQGPTSDIIDPGSIYPATLTGSDYWDKWGTGSDGSAARLTLVDTKAGGGAAGWADVPKAGGSISGNLAYVAPMYGVGLYMVGNGGAAFTANLNHASANKHFIVNLGISGSALNDDVTSAPTALGHWDPSVDDGAFELLTEHYIQPAFANLQTSSGVIYLDAIYIDVAGDALSSVFPYATAHKYGSHLMRLISGLEAFLEFPGVPVVLIAPPTAPTTFPYLGTLRSALARVAALRPRTYLLNTYGYPQGPDELHYNGMSMVKIGYEAAQLVRTRLPNQWANITKTF